MTPQAIKVQVDPRKCEGHGLCIELAPDVFDINSDDVATVLDELPDEKHAAVVNAAAAACPRQAISVTSAFATARTEGYDEARSVQSPSKENSL